MFDHEKLDAYRLAIDFISWAHEIDATVTTTRRVSALRHLEDASSSIAFNIAEGNGKRSVPDRVRFLEIARGSAFECAACTDVLVLKGHVDDAKAAVGKQLLVRIVSTITKLIEHLESARTRTRTSTIREPGWR